MIGLEQWRASIGGWYSGNLSATYRRYGSRRIVRGWSKLLPIIDNYSATIYYFVYWLIVVLYAFTSEGGLFVALSLGFDNNCGYSDILKQSLASTAIVRIGRDSLKCVWVSTKPPILQACTVQWHRLWTLASPSTTAPMLRLLLALNWLLIVAGDVELNPGPLPTTEYKKLQQERDKIIRYLADQKILAQLADKLLGAGFITRSVYDRAKLLAPGEVERDRVTVMFDAVLASMELNPLKYNTFLRILKEIEGLGDLVVFITGAGQASSNEPSNTVIYTKDLRDIYRTQIPTFRTDQWPPLPVQKVLHLAMIQEETIRRGSVDKDMIRLTLQGKINDILPQKKEIELSNIFQIDQAERKVILIEGAPGAGKSTLAWHICQQWGAEKLFQIFQTVVFIPLRDPAIQSAKSLEDILPTADRNQAEKVAAELKASKGKDLLFVMDGWDELPLDLYTNSIFYKIIASPMEQNLHCSAVVITSRPVASGDLYRTITSRIEILGFTPIEIKGYFTEALGDSRAVQKLQDQLKERPMIEASCYLPLNAAIVVHLFLAQNQSLPTTLHGVFTSLVVCCLIRHTTKQKSPKSCFSSLDNLPLCLQEPFKNICTLAYHGIMDDKATFSSEDLQRFKLPPELEGLGLLQGIQSFTSFGTSVTYNFLHLSVQELLASLHISKLPGDEEVKIFTKLFSQPRFAAVFKFYTAFTKLKTEGIQKIITKIVKKKDKSQLVHLLNGLYEAQDLSLCQFVMSQLYGNLDLSRTSLSPVDCLCIGYFLFTISKKFVIDLRLCSLDYDKITYLVKEFSKRSSSSKHRTTVEDVVVQGSTELDL